MPTVHCDAGGRRIDGIAVGASADRDEHAVEVLRLGRIRALEGDVQFAGARLHRRRASAQHDALITLLDPPLQNPDQIPVGAGHQALAQFDDTDRGAERFVHARHFQADDPAADHQQALAARRQLQRARRIDDSRIIR